MSSVSAFDTLASLIEEHGSALLTITGRHGASRTRTVRSLRTPFRGHLWLDTGRDHGAARDIGSGVEVTVAYGDTTGGPRVTITGWAVVLRESDAPEPANSEPAHGHVSTGWRAAVGERTPLVCVTAHAAQLFEDAAGARGRVFAFAPHQLNEDQIVLAQDAGRPPSTYRAARADMQSLDVPA